MGSAPRVDVGKSGEKLEARSDICHHYLKRSTPESEKEDAPPTLRLRAFRSRDALSVSARGCRIGSALAVATIMDEK